MAYMGSPEHDAAEHLEKQAIAEARFDAAYEHLEEEAVQSIIDDYLLLGYSYPKRGGKDCVTAGMIVEIFADDDEIELMLSALVYGAGDMLDRQQRYAQALVKEASQYLREKHPSLIELRVEELMQEDAE